MTSEAQNQRKHFFLWGIVLIFSVFIGISLGIILSLTSTKSDVIASGVYIEGIDVGGKNYEQAYSLLAEKLPLSDLEEDITLYWQENFYNFSPQNIKAKLDLERGLQEAMDLGKNKGFFNNFYERYLLKTQGKNIKVHLIVDKQALEMFVSQLAEKIDKEPLDAQIIVGADNSIYVMGEKHGQKLNQGQTCQKIEQTILEKNKHLFLPVQLWAADVTAKKIHDRGIKSLLATSITHFSPTKENRVYNISVAAKAIDDLMLKPGATFSFNKIVGPRSQEAGYKTAGVIINNEMVEGIGGGVCQVSSTLYNAVLQADLEIVERVNHSTPVAYLPLGQDATVAYDYLDFKFKNNTANYIFIKAQASNNSIMIRIFGADEPKKQVSVFSETVYQDDNKIKVNTWRNVQINGKESKKEIIGRSTYIIKKENSF